MIWKYVILDWPGLYFTMPRPMYWLNMLPQDGTEPHNCCFQPPIIHQQLICGVSAVYSQKCLVENHSYQHLILKIKSNWFANISESLTKAWKTFPKKVKRLSRRSRRTVAKSRKIYQKCSPTRISWQSTY